MANQNKKQTVLIDGFHGGISNDGLQWYCAPDSWNNADEKGEKNESSPASAQGSWKVNPETGALTLFPAPKRDFWQKTYYEPLLIADDGAILYASLPYYAASKDKAVAALPATPQYYTLQTTFRLFAVCQFDQAGLMVRWDEHHWIKTGIEVVDKKARLSCVVTNHGYSDWSTQAWPCVEEHDKEDGNRSDQLVVDCTIRLHCRGESFVVQVHNNTKEGATENDDEWEFVRIAHMNKPSGSSTETTTTTTTTTADPPAFMAGVFACCPQDQKGGHATFSSFQIVEGSQFGHHA